MVVGVPGGREAAEGAEIVDDRRDTMDTAVRLSCTAFVAATAVLALLWRSGGWILLSLLLLAVSRIAYRGAAVAYGEAVEATFDLHRFDLVAALRLPLPADHVDERDPAKAVSAFWRQPKPVSFISATPIRRKVGRSETPRHRLREGTRAHGRYLTGVPLMRHRRSAARTLITVRPGGGPVRGS